MIANRTVAPHPTAFTDRFIWRVVPTAVLRIARSVVLESGESVDLDVRPVRGGVVPVSYTLTTRSENASIVVGAAAL